MLIILQGFSNFLEVFHMIQCSVLLENSSPKSSGEQVGLRNRNKEKVCAAWVKKSGESQRQDEKMVQRDAGKETESENWSRV